MLCWIDMETTGLSFDQDIPLEVGIILMEEDGMLEIARKRWLCRVSGFVIEPLDPFVLEMHTKNNLLNDLQASSPWSSYNAIDDDICRWIGEHVPENSDTFLYPAGSSVHFDIRFAERRFPKFHSFLHHRHLDVSSVRMLYTLIGAVYDKGDDPHRALGDLDNDIDWLRSYMENVLDADS